MTWKEIWWQGEGRVVGIITKLIWKYLGAGRQEVLPVWSGRENPTQLVYSPSVTEWQPTDGGKQKMVSCLIFR